MTHHHLLATRARSRQRGMSLIVILLLMVIVSMLGAASMQIANMGEHGARNDRDMQLALQSAEAGLIDAEIDLQGTKTTQGTRTAKFKSGNARFPDHDCGTDGDRKGLCALETSADKPAVWLTANYEYGTDTANFGEFTRRTYQNAGVSDGRGVQPAQPPRYVIENVGELSAVRSGMVTGAYDSALPDGGSTQGEQLYRVTAMGFGPRSTTQAVLQTIYRN